MPIEDYLVHIGNGYCEEYYSAMGYRYPNSQIYMCYFDEYHDKWKRMNEIKKWCTDNCIPVDQYKYYNATRSMEEETTIFFIKNKDDATFFYMVWI